MPALRGPQGALRDNISVDALASDGGDQPGDIQLLGAQSPASSKLGWRHYFRIHHLFVRVDDLVVKLTRHTWACIALEMLGITVGFLRKQLLDKVVLELVKRDELDDDPHDAVNEDSKSAKVSHQAQRQLQAILRSRAFPIRLADLDSVY